MKIEFNKTYQGDCLKLMKSIPDGSVDMVLCDLPYGVTENKWDLVIDPADMWREYLRVGKSNAAYVLTASQPFTTTLITSQMKLYKYNWTWVKNRTGNFANANKQPLRATEDVCVFYAKQCIYNPQGVYHLQVGKKVGARIARNIGNYNFNYTPKNKVKEDFGNAKYGFSVSKSDATSMPGFIQTVTNYPTNVLEFASETECFHPTQKPVALFEYLVRTYTNEGATVLDNTCGSGTTGVACKRSGRNFIQMDLSEEYCVIARRRYEDNLWKVPYKMPDARRRLL